MSMSVLLATAIGASIHNPYSHIGDLFRKDGYSMSVKFSKKEPKDWFYHTVNGVVVLKFRNKNDCNATTYKIKTLSDSMYKDAKIKVKIDKQCFGYVLNDGLPESGNDALEIFNNTYTK